MPQHVVVDGSNIATEGRSAPSLAQLNEAVMAFMAEHPEALITVVVDATFGHRIDSKEAKEFDEAVANNELVAPPAGAVGRGDAFVLSIANKVGAVILTNDSFQEFHGQYDWLFDEGRLIGGKPVPHIGWVFVPRIPVRGPVSRSAMKDAKRKKSGGSERRGGLRQGSPEASQPMPVPKAPPPGVRPVTPGRSHAAAEHAAPKHAVEPTAPAMAAIAATAAPKAGAAVNDLLPFLSFVEHHPVGSSVNAIVENYSSHGAYVRVGDVKGYVPLRLMADPAPRSAREFMKIGDAVTLVVESFAPARRSIDLAVAAMATAKPPIEPVKTTKRAKQAKPEPGKAEAGKAEAGKAGKPSKPKAKAKPDQAPAKPGKAAKSDKAIKPDKAGKASKTTTAASAPMAVTEPAPAKKPARSRAAAPAPDVAAAPAPVATPAPAAPAAPVRAKRAAKATVPTPEAPPAIAPKRARAAKSAPAAPVAAGPTAAVPAPAKRAGATKAAAPAAATDAPAPAPRRRRSS